MYGSVELEKGLYVDRVLPNMESSFYLKQQSIEAVDSEAATKEGDYVKVQITVRNLMHTRKDKLSSTSDSHLPTARDKEIETSVTNKDEIEAFVIVARNMTDREKLLEDMMKREQRYKERMKVVDFDAQMKLSTFRKQFKKYCRTVLATEQSTDAFDLIGFLDVAEGYKKLPFEQRMNQQATLYDTYVREGAPQRLSVMNKNTQLESQVSLKISKSVGDQDVFDDVEEAVKMRLVTEYYNGYMAQLQVQESESASTNSSDETTTAPDTTTTHDTTTVTTSGEHTDR
jgi:hypothetical protein